MLAALALPLSLGTTPMPYNVNDELRDIAGAIEDRFDCSPFDAHQAALAVKEVVDRHRGERNAVEMRERLERAVVAWDEATPEEKRKAYRRMMDLAGDFQLTPDDDE